MRLLVVFVPLNKLIALIIMLHVAELIRLVVPSCRAAAEAAVPMVDNQYTQTKVSVFSLWCLDGASFHLNLMNTCRQTISHSLFGVFGNSLRFVTRCVLSLRS